jgi:hypothetical protein
MQWAPFCRIRPITEGAAATVARAAFITIGLFTFVEVVFSARQHHLWCILRALPRKRRRKGARLCYRLIAPGVATKVAGLLAPESLLVYARLWFQRLVEPAKSSGSQGMPGCCLFRESHAS